MVIHKYSKQWVSLVFAEKSDIRLTFRSLCSFLKESRQVAVGDVMCIELKEKKCVWKLIGP